jgi:hypothetical protein
LKWKKQIFTQFFTFLGSVLTSLLHLMTYSAFLHFLTRRLSAPPTLSLPRNLIFFLYFNFKITSSFRQSVLLSFINRRQPASSFYWTWWNLYAFATTFIFSTETRHMPQPLYYIFKLLNSLFPFRAYRKILAHSRSYLVIKN